MSHFCNDACNRILRERAAGEARPYWNSLAQRSRNMWTQQSHPLAMNAFFRQKRMTLTKRLVQMFQRWFRPFSGRQYTRELDKAPPDFCSACGKERE